MLCFSDVDYYLCFFYHLRLSISRLCVAMKIYLQRQKYPILQLLFPLVQALYSCLKCHVNVQLFVSVLSAEHNDSLKLYRQNESDIIIFKRLSIFLHYLQCSIHYPMFDTHERKCF
jgi:hypothetical protein